MTVHATTHGRGLLRAAALIFIVATAVNYAWELAQAPLYDWPGESRDAMWHCFVASLGDGVIVLAIYAVVSLALRRTDWLARPGVPGYAAMLAAGLAIAVAIEWFAVYRLGRWTYTEDMPVVPGLDIGAVPVVQMLVLPPLVFRLVARLQRATG